LDLICQTQLRTKKLSSITQTGDTNQPIQNERICFWPVFGFSHTDAFVTKAEMLLKSPGRLTVQILKPRRLIAMIEAWRTLAIRFIIPFAIRRGSQPAVRCSSRQAPCATALGEMVDLLPIGCERRQAF
jgi:hypothetical protein